MTKPFHQVRRGLTLLEVMLAISIFGLSLVAIGELIRIGSLCAASARDLTEAQRLCNNVMAEVGSGITLPEAASDTPIEGSEGWLYTIESTQLDEQEGMLKVTVTVQQDPIHNAKPAKFTLVRWMTDPAAVAAAQAAAAEADAAAAAATTSSSTSGSTPSSSSGSTPSSGAQTGASSGS